MGNEKELLALARKLYAEGKLKESEVVFNQLKVSNDFASEALSGLGMIRLRAGNNSAASELFEAALARKATNADAHYGLGVIAERQSTLEAALAYYQEALRLNPKHRGAADGINKLQKNPSGRSSELMHDSVSSQRDTDAMRNEVARARTQGQPVSPNPSPDASALALESGELLDSKHRTMNSFSFHFLFTLIVTVLLGLVCGWLSLLALFAFSSGTKDEHVAGVLAFVGALSIIVISWKVLRMRAKRTVYDIYERRIDIREGLLIRKESSIWTFEITNPTLHRSPLDVILGNGRISLIDNPSGETNNAKIIGFGSFEDTRALWQALRDTAIKDRLTIKRMWI
ncbi:tetratricopeptide repeat protein [Burkholderia sp. AU6039]|uniref:tetratricopeptide repeat protein n=1 Tax=Burkholderia sp. AU6039 TaxID=2015344 RepID=UPI0015C6393B|nr:tetratricopeptide repeat protein [Burkholderia sp. AU6039]